MYVIKLDSASFPGALTLLDGEADRLALSSYDVPEFLKNSSPKHIFLTKFEAERAWERSLQIVASDDYSQKIEKGFWIRHGDSSPRKLEEYISELLNRIHWAEIVPLASLGEAV
jgi:hypothetical protein